ncbi:response regulator [Variovorax sp. PBL-E5]|uniref:response regulator n=1 Tax=Variovorax sp. PBL-E5 TaxID=434014 RepID=UPI0013198DA0|nr:response regulator [Variovorax sp. PBL-E5]VTU17707.1 Gliding motility regulatory protein [Variovorax sp. PBL-E5]
MTGNAQVPAARSPGPLRILVVEDDPDTLAATLEMIRLLGHWATGVRSAEIAKDRFFEGAFDVLMTDVGLPALSGLDLAEILRSRHTLEVIFATGQPRPARPMPGTVWLRKPFDVEQLEAALGQTRNRAAAA